MRLGEEKIVWTWSTPGGSTQASDHGLLEWSASRRWSSAGNRGLGSGGCGRRSHRRPWGNVCRHRRCVALMRAMHHLWLRLRRGRRDPEHGLMHGTTPGRSARLAWTLWGSRRGGQPARTGLFGDPACGRRFWLRKLLLARAEGGFASGSARLWRWLCAPGQARIMGLYFAGRPR